MKKSYIFLLISFLFLYSCTSVSKIELSKNENLGNNMNEFIKNGFGFSYIDSEVHDMSNFIINHGVPIGIEKSDFRNNHDGIIDEKCIIKYSNYEICFLNFAPRTSWKAPKSLLMYISSIDNGHYKYGIMVGDKEKDIMKKLDIKMMNSNNEYQNKDGNILTFVFRNDKVNRIIWEYGRE
jgi:hypothetical protein